VASVDNVSQQRKHYKGQVEFFGVYCPDLQKCYLVPVDAVGINAAYLRVDNPKTAYVCKNTRWARDYELNPGIEQD
jgi:hypothetical protein